MGITESILEYRQSQRLVGLAKAAWQVARQGRLLEFGWSCWCLIRHRPPTCDAIDLPVDVVHAARRCVAQAEGAGRFIHRDILRERYGRTYALELPGDFWGVRAASLVVDPEFLVLGEYADDSALLVLATRKTTAVVPYYNQRRGFRHIHAIHRIGNSSRLLVATGDTRKVLDEWAVQDGQLHFVRRVRHVLAGYTGVLRMGNVDYFGTDFSSRPNYIETLNRRKYFFPRPAYDRLVVGLFAINERYLVALNSELPPVGEALALSIFDTDEQRFVYSEEYLAYPPSFCDS